MKYFNNVKNLQELKKQYRALAMKLHPDKGGDEEQFKALVNEYEQLLRILAKENNKDEEKFDQEVELEEEYLKVVNQLISFDGLIIEILGSWIWISGKTYPARAKIKELGFKWSKEKTMWYLPDEDRPIRKYKNKGKDINEIRAKHGVKAKIKTKGAKQIA